MSIPVIGEIVCQNDNPFFGVTDDEQVTGGYRTVSDIATRDAIFDGRKKIGMVVFVQSTATEYRWNGATWDTIQAGAGGADTQIQYNASGALAGSASLTWDDSSKAMVVAGELKVDGVADTQQLVVEAHSSQANDKPLIELRDSSGTDVLSITSNDYRNVFVGRGAGNANVLALPSLNGLHNVYVGNDAGRFNQSGFANIAIGARALYQNVDGYENVVIGYRAMEGAGDANDNVALGYAAMQDRKEGFANFALGTFALRRNTAGRYNVCIGVQAGEGVAGLSEYQGVVLIGQTAGKDLRSSANYEVGIGYNALRYNATGSGNVCVGPWSGHGVSGNSFSGNTYIGIWAGRSTSTGGYNATLGYLAGNTITTGSRNICLGADALTPLPTSSYTLNIGDLIIGKLDAAKSIAFDTDSVRVISSQSPASGGAGVAGEIAWDASYIYVCTAANTWKRAALTGGY